MDMINIAVDEIAFSGLEGVTVPVLWECLRKRESPLEVDGDEDLKNFLWRGILQCRQVKFLWYNPESKKKPEEKKKSKRAPENTVKGDPKDSCGGAKLPKDWISDTENDICGYCPGYYSREDVTNQVREAHMSYSEAYAKWKDNFLIVGTQDLRRHVLFDNEIPCDINMTDLRFIFLAIIGRGRHNGFLQKDFKNYSMDSRSTFHQIKILANQGLITKQKYQLRGLQEGPIKTNILFLKRFHKQLATEANSYSKNLCDILLQEPGCVMELTELKNTLKLSTKLFKRIRGNLYKNGFIQYIQKGEVFNHSQGQESLLRKFVWSQPILVQCLKPYEVEEIEIDEDDEESYISQCKFVNPQVVNEIHLNQQMYWLIESAKEKGMTVQEFGSMSCMPYHMARSFARQLDRKNCAKVVMTDKSRQKVHTIVAAKYLHKSEVVKQINTEFDKAVDLTKDAPDADKDVDKSQVKAEEIENVDQEENISKIEDKGNKQFIKNLELKPVNQRKENTVRGMKRRNIILEKIKELRIIEGSNPIFKAVSYQEQQQGVKERVCRKSVHRILNRMVGEDLIRKYETVIKNSENTANVVYYCDPSVSMEDDEFKTAINETKFRLKGIVERRECKEGKIKENFIKSQEPKNPAPANLSLLDYVSVNDGQDADTDTDDEAYEPIVGSAYQRSQYGYLPRFPRMKMLQMYLWQLVYGTDEDAAKYKRDHDFSVKEDGDEHEWRYEVYGWLTELIKLPSSRHGKGHFQTGDALAIMPLIVFTKCVGICMKSKTLEKILKHPKKKFTPLRDLPPKLKAKLFKTRNVGFYVGHFVEMLVLLTHLGLLYITPEPIPLNRTQIVMLVSKEAMLIDTTQSEKGYSKTQLPPNMTAFPKLSYRFDDLASIEKYWKDVQYVCLNTKLGLVKPIRKEEVSKKSRPCRTLMTLRNFQEHFPAEELGNAKPKLFGDGLGAGGFDSTFFGHLPKNWIFPGANRNYLSQSNVHTKDSNAKSLKKFTGPTEGFKTSVKSSLAVKATIGGRGKKRKRVFDNKIVTGPSSAKKAVPEPKKAEDVKLKKIMAARYRQKLAKMAKTNKTPRNPGHKPPKDATDLEAVKKMKGFRVNYSPSEDAAILMVRITAELLNFDFRKINYWPTARDMIHADLPEARDKTIESLSRRGRYILKNALTLENMKSCVLECRADRSLDTKPPDAKEEAWKAKFKDLYSKVQQKYKRKLEPDAFTFELPDTLTGLKEMFHINKAFEKKGSTSNAISVLSNSRDVDVNVLEELIHNSLAGQNTKEYMPSLVFRIFDRYPASYLEKALFSMKAKSLVARLRVHVPRRRALPISTMSYSLSLAYERLFETPYTPHLFPAAKEFLKSIRNGKGKTSDASNSNEGKVHFAETSKSHEGSSGNAEKGRSLVKGEDRGLEAPPGTLIYSRDDVLGGHVACMLSLLLNDKAFVELDIPDNIVQCDTEEADKLGNVEDGLSTASITVMKRKMYANNLEEALETAEDRAMENAMLDSKEEDVCLERKPTDEPVLVDSGSIKDGTSKENFNDGKGITGWRLDDGNASKSNSLEKKKANILENTKSPKVEPIRTGFSRDQTQKGMAQSLNSFEIISSEVKDDTNSPAPGSSRNVGMTVERMMVVDELDRRELEQSSLHASDKPPSRRRGIQAVRAGNENDENGIPKKKLRVSFDDDVRTTVPAGAETHDVAGTSSTTNQKRHSSKKNDSSKKEKEQKIIRNATGIGDKNVSGVVNFNMTKGFISTSFFSDQELIDRYKDDFSNKQKLKQEFTYSSNVGDVSGMKQSKNFVPRKAFEIRKSKLYASRTTLMLHREADTIDLQGKALTAHEALNTNPVAIACHLYSRPFAQNAIDASASDQDREKLESNDNDLHNEFDKRLERFANRDEFLHSETEIENGLKSLSMDEFCILMTVHFGWNDKEVAFAKEAVECVKANRELGLTELAFNEIHERCTSIRELSEIVDMLLNFKVIYRVGMYTTRYVSPAHVKNWSINAPLSRGGDEEIIDVIAKKQLIPASAASSYSETGSGKKRETGSDVSCRDEIKHDKSEIQDGGLAVANSGDCRKKDETLKDGKCGPNDITLNLGGSLKAGQSLLHVKNSNNACLQDDAKIHNPSKPIATIVRIDNKASDVTDMTANRGSDHNAKKAKPTRDAERTLGHVLGPKSVRTELMYKRATCRPWLKLNCDYNLTLFRKFHRAVLSLIMMYPGIKESRIYSRFETVLKPVALREILLFLELNGCISKHYSRKKNTTSLFEPIEANFEAEFTFDDPYYMPREDCVLNITDNAS